MPHKCSLYEQWLFIYLLQIQIIYIILKWEKWDCPWKIDTFNIWVLWRRIDMFHVDNVCVFVTENLSRWPMDNAWKVWRKNDMPHVDNAFPTIIPKHSPFEHPRYPSQSPSVVYVILKVMHSCFSTSEILQTYIRRGMKQCTINMYGNKSCIVYFQYHNFVHECVNSPSQWPNTLKMIYGKQVQSTLYIDAT
jgi:hypothetical protein